MNPSIPEIEFEKIKSFSTEFFKNPEDYQFLVKPETQETEIQKLKIGLREEQFFIVIDLLNTKILAHGGLDAFGHEQDSFSLKDYFSLMPESGITSLLTVLGKQTFALSEVSLIDFLKPTFIAQVPLKLYSKSEKLFLVKRGISPWQITACGKITAYLSHFTLIKEYNYEEISPRIIGIPQKTLEQVMKTFNFSFIQQKARENPFSPKEILLLKQYLDDDKSVSDILKNLSIKLNTLHGYNKSILTKTKKLFGERIPVKTARDAASYIKKQGLLEY